MNNAQKLINALNPIGRNLNGDCLVTIKDYSPTEVFILKQSRLKMSLGAPCIETTLHNANSGKRLFIARDESGKTHLAVAQQCFREFEFKCNDADEIKAKKQTRVLVDMLGYLD
jgi:hypothetical protein